MLKTGTRLADRYEIVKTLGGGGMAIVYQARDHVLDRWIAIKVMNQSLRNNNEFIHRFIREAKAAGSLSHPNVVNIFDIGREGSTYYMVMEYVEGISLDAFIESKGVIDPNEAINITVQVCDGLSHAHQHGIIHRDVKAQNIMRSVDGRYKVTDFGISFFSNMSTSLTQTGTVMGSAHYFSPEQASGGKVTFASDLYSVGVLLFLLVTGRFPFDADNSVSIAVKHLQEPVPDPRKFNPKIPIALSQLILKAMEKQPEKRFQTAKEMKDALIAVQCELKGKEEVSTSKQNSIDTGHHSLPSRHVKHSRQETKKSKTYLFIGSAVVFGLLLLLIPIWFLFDILDSKEDPKQPIQPTTVHNDKKNQTPPPQMPPPTKTDLEGDHPWWKEMPKEKYKENKFFKDFQVSGEDGEYEVTLQVGKFPESTFYYNIYVVDSFSSRLILNGRSVSITRNDSSDYTSKTFHVSIPEQLLPTTGLVKIEIYRKGKKKPKADPTDNILQQWGKPPDEKDDEEDD